MARRRKANGSNGGRFARGNPARGTRGLLLFSLLSTACFATTSSTIVPIPPGVWTTRPIPCPYEEIAIAWSESVHLGLSSKQVFRWFYASSADALIDYEVRTRVMSGAVIFTVSGLAITWLGDGCPSRPKTFKEAMKAREGLPDIEKFGPPKPVRTPYSAGIERRHLSR